VEKFFKKIGKTSKKKGARYSDVEKHLLLCEFIIKRSKVKGLKISGADWETSIRTLLFEVFKEDWDKDDNNQATAKIDSEITQGRVIEGLGVSA
jgi:hypothetical protein